ncbi:MAG: zinc ABC transporter substrate-binding protein [Simkaniaceae bacterium]|nr:MAG: zinc ABC transporter substrate-binding protein [Simkaniaceae bacterium]
MKWILIISITCFLVACGKSSQSSYMTSNGKVKVLSTTAMIDDLVAEIGGDEIDHTSLIVGNLDPHSYELVKGDDEKFLQADLIFYNGLGLEHGASLHEHLEKHSNAIGLGDLLIAEDKKAFLIIDDQLDPHFWMDIELFSRVISPIVTALSEKDPTHAALYKERGDCLKIKMLDKDKILLQKIQKIPSEKRYLVSSHDAFYYFARKYLADSKEEDWEKRFMAPEGLAPDGQMSVLDIQEVSEFLCENQIHVVFPETNINRDALKKIVAICREKGLHVRIATTPLYGDTMGTKGTGADTYLDMIEHNVHTLADQLPKE